MDLLATTPTSTLLNYSRIHVELSSKCTLKCPRCPRTELHPDNLNKDITLEEFRRAFTPGLLSQVNDLTFCGNVGDPIYNRDFLEIVEYIKTHSHCRLVIVTNGSYKHTSWWEELGSMLTRYDQVTFSIDGWDQASNEQYRVNSDFDSIIDGARSLRKSSRVHMNWSAIYFKFNEKNFAWIKDLAKDVGFDTFEAVRSSKFNGRYEVNGVDNLKPVDFYVTTGQYQVHTETINPEFKMPIIMNLYRNVHPWARCVNWQKEMFINIDGLVFPCPWFASGYQENDFVEKYQDQINIKTRSLIEILEDPLWEELLTRFEIAPLDICKIKCYAQQ